MFSRSHLFLGSDKISLYYITTILIFVVLYPSYVNGENTRAAPEIKTRNISANLIDCRIISRNSEDPTGFIRDLRKREEKVKYFSQGESIRFALVLMIRELRSDVSLEWVVVWSDDEKGRGTGIKYRGVIPTEAAPGSPSVRFFFEVEGKEMTLYPIQAGPPNNRGRGKGRHHASLYSIKIDGQPLEYSCTRNYVFE